VYFEYICLKYAGRLLNRENTPLGCVHTYTSTSTSTALYGFPYTSSGKQTCTETTRTSKIYK